MGPTDVRWLLRLRPLLVALVTILLAACPRPLVAPPVGQVGVAQATVALTGVVDFGTRQLQASLETDVAPSATVSFIDVATGQTVITARTDAQGKFLLNLPNSFRPTASGLYYIEAIKGLGHAAGGANAVGADAVRVRTIAAYHQGGWATLSNAASASITVNATSTAVALIVSLRASTARAIDARTLIGSIQPGVPQAGYPDTVTSPDLALMPLVMVQRAYDLVSEALAENRDPFQWIRLDESDALLDTLLLPDVPFSVASLAPSRARSLDTIDLVGTGFAGTVTENVVSFTGDGQASVSAQVLAVNPERTRLSVRVPATAVSGPTYLTIAGKTLRGPLFSLEMGDGHSVVDPSGNVYAANRVLGTVTVAGEYLGGYRYGIRPVITGLDGPGALTFGPEGYPWLYVACGGAARSVYKLDVSQASPTPLSITSGSGVLNPSGMAFQASTGDLYLSDSIANQLYRVPSGGGAVTAVLLSGEPLNQPRGLCFGPDGKLYVANAGGHSVLSVDVASGISTLYLAALNRPWGVAFDPRGSLYVSNNGGNAIYRMPVVSAPGDPLVYGMIAPFAALPSPGGLDADPSGYLYAADNVSNGLYRIDPSGRRHQIGYGLDSPTSIWADANGLYTLTEAGRILFHDSSTQVLSMMAEGLSSASGLVKDGAGNLYTNQSNLNAIVRIPPVGAPETVLSGLGTSPNSELHIRNDKLYVRSNTSFDPPSTTYSGQGEVLAFDLNALGTPTQRLRTLLRGAVAIARDESGGAYNGQYYILQGQEASVLRVQRLASNRASIVKVFSDPTRLKNPMDLHVDPSGRIWIADYDGVGGTGGLYVYDATGAFVADYSAQVSKPTNLASDGDGVGVYVNSHLSSGDIRQISYGSGGLIRTIPGFNLPRGFAFTDDRSTLYVNEWGLDRLTRLSNYQSQTTPLTAFCSVPDSQDVETSGTAVVYANSSRLSKVEADGQTVTTNYNTQYYPILRTFKQSDGMLAFVQSAGWLNLLSDGYFTAFTANLSSAFGRGDYGPPRGAGLVTGTAFFSFGRAGAWTNISETLLDGSLSRTFYVPTDFGGMATNGLDEVYFTAMPNATVYKLKNGTLTTLSSSGFASAIQASMGIAYDSGQLYQTLRTRHRIDRIDAVTGARTTMSIGLMAPEL